MSDGLNLCISRKMQPIRDLVAKVADTNITVLVRGRERHRQGGRRPRHPRPRRAPPSRSSRSTARRCPGSCSRASCSATRRAPSPAPSGASSGKFEYADQGHDLPRRDRRDALRAPGEAAAGAPGRRVLARRRRERSSRSTRGSSPPPTGTSRTRSHARRVPRGPLLPPERGRRSASRRCASDAEEIPLLVDHFLRKFGEQYGSTVRALSPRHHARASWTTTGRATCASSRTWCSAWSCSGTRRPCSRRSRAAQTAPASARPARPALDARPASPDGAGRPEGHRATGRARRRARRDRASARPDALEPREGRRACSDQLQGAALQDRAVWPRDAGREGARQGSGDRGHRVLTGAARPPALLAHGAATRREHDEVERNPERDHDRR